MKFRILSALLAVIISVNVLAVPAHSYIGIEPNVIGGLARFGVANNIFDAFDFYAPTGNDETWGSWIFDGGQSRGYGASRYVPGRGFVSNEQFGGRGGEQSMIDGFRNGFGRTTMVSHHPNNWWLHFDDVYLNWALVNNSGVTSFVDISIPTDMLRGMNVRYFVFGSAVSNHINIIGSNTHAYLLDLPGVVWHTLRFAVPALSCTRYTFIAQNNWIPSRHVSTATYNIRLDRIHSNTAYGISWSTRNLYYYNERSTLAYSTANNRAIFRRATNQLPPAVTINNTYSSTRIGGVHANFGHLNNYGELIVAENVRIVNEDNRSWHNPVTNTTNYFNTFEYNFETREYHITNIDNSVTNIRFGDEYVTIIHGDKITQIFYIVVMENDDPGSGTPTLCACYRSGYEWCILTHYCAAVIFAERCDCPRAPHPGDGDCCGTGGNEPGGLHAIAAAIVAHGMAIRDGLLGMFTGFGNDTNIVDPGNPNPGYGNPGNGGGDSSSGGGGILDWIFGGIGATIGAAIRAVGALIYQVLSAIFDVIVSLVDTVLSGLGAMVNLALETLLIVPTLFSGFTDFLTSVFAFLPEEVTTLIIFGVLAIVLVGIIRMTIGR